MASRSVPVTTLFQQLSRLLRNGLQVHSSPWIVAERRDGILRIIEIGDGQVSDRKHWSVERFIQMLASWCARHSRPADAQASC
jgi:hypothetical protein